MRQILPASWNRDFIWGGLLLAATFLVYQPAWNGTPVWDDNMHITPLALRSMDGLVRIWTYSRETTQYFPLVHTVFWVGTNLWGDSTLGFHIINILLHVSSALILVKILSKLNIPGPWLAAAIFALHPVMVESVAWISELKNTLSGVFFLAAALAYLTYDENRNRRRYAWSLVLFILGLLSKPTIATFPFAMLAITWWKRGRPSWKRDIVPLLPFLLSGILFGLIVIHVEQTRIGSGERVFELSLIERCLLAARAGWFYLAKIFLPINLMFSYPRWVLSAAVWWQYLFPAATLMLGGVLWTLRKVRRAPAAAFFYFAVMLLPYLGFISFYTFRYTYVADHYQYLAAIGPIVIAVGSAGTALGSAREGRGALKTAGALILLLMLGMLSWKQSKMYSDAETLYRTTIERNDSSWMAHDELGILLSKTKREDEALVQYRRALELNPDFVEAHNNVGLLLSEMGRPAEALAHYQKALDLSPNLTKVHNNLGLLLAKMHRPDEALSHYQKALELNPDNAETEYNLGGLFEDIGRPDEALAHYQRALEIDPNLTKAHNNVGSLLSARGRPDEALAHYLKALEIDPNQGEVEFNLGSLLDDMGRMDEALTHYQRALELRPNRAEIHYALGLLLAKMGRSDEAMNHYQKATELNPNHAEAHNNLGILLAGKGQFDEAIAHFHRALEVDPSAIGILKNLAVALAQQGHVTDATAVLETALASATSAGDEAREKKLAQILELLRRTFRSP